MVQRVEKDVQKQVQIELYAAQLRRQAEAEAAVQERDEKEIADAHKAKEQDPENPEASCQCTIS